MLRKWIVGSVGLLAASAMLIGTPDSAWARRGGGRCFSRCGGGYGGGYQNGWGNQCCGTNTAINNCASGGCSSGGCNTGGCSTGGCNASNGATMGTTPVVSQDPNLNATGTQYGVAPQPSQPYTTGYRAQTNVDVNGNVIQNNNRPFDGNNRQVAPAINSNNNVNPVLNNSAPASTPPASGKINAQGDSSNNSGQSNAAGNAGAPPDAKAPIPAKAQ